MRKIIKIMFIIICMIILIGCMQGSKNTGWEVVKIFKSLKGIAENNNITNVQIGFLNDKIGFAISRGNHVYYSSDSGDKWSETVVKTNPCLSGMEILDENNIVIGCQCSYLEYSTDSGKSWTKTDESSFAMFSFYNNNSGFIAKSLSSTNIIKIMENFKTANEMKLPKEFEKKAITTVACPSVNEAYILFYGRGPLLKTIDGGKTWEKINFDITKNRSLFQSPDTTRMRFTDSNNGIIVTFDNKDKTWISLTTKDGGKSWKHSKILNTSRGLRSYISKDGNYLTIVNENKDENPVMLLKRKI